MSDYHYLVASLPEIAFDGSKVNFSIERFREEVCGALSKTDLKKISLFFYAWDNKNLLELLRNGHDAKIQRIGCFDSDELTELITSTKNGDKRTSKYPAYMYDFLEKHFENVEQPDAMLEDLLASHYYTYAVNCGNKFLSEWFTFNRDLSNLQVAFIARKHKLNVSDYIIGENETANALRTSSARDFGLTGSIDYLETVQRICDMDKLYERERQIDELRWKWLEENSVFIYFSAEVLYVFLQKLDIIERWASLDTEAGVTRYNELIEGLKSGLTINDEDFQ